MPSSATAHPIGSALPEPVSPVERIEAIDALRGFALFGVLMVNLVTEFRVSIFSQFLPYASPAKPWDKLVMQLVSAGLEMKAFSLFSLLFGVGLAVQFGRLDGRKDRGVLMSRRMGALLAFGLVHLFLIWSGDILTEYAVAGLLVLPLLYAPRWTTATVAVSALAFYAAMPYLQLPIDFPPQHWLARHVAEAGSVLGHGSLFQVVRFNAAEVPRLLPLHLFVFPRTIGLFALGMWLWRAGYFSVKLHALSAATAIMALTIGIVLTRGGPWFAAAHLARAANQLAPPILALGYAGVILWLATGERARALVMWAAPLGRMAFTNYIAQSVIFGFIFYGYGMGLFDRLDPLPTFALGVGVYVLEVVASRLWLRRYQFGPLEWLWRTLMYGRFQRMRRSNQVAEGSPSAA